MMIVSLAAMVREINANSGVLRESALVSHLQR